MESKFDEEFKVCPDNASLKVNQYGIVKNEKNEILKQDAHNGKYFIVEDPSKKRPFELVHRLVALTWKRDKYESGKNMFVHHINGKTFDNRAWNLAWVDECFYAFALHGKSVDCDSCNEESCEYREHFQTMPASIPEN